MLAALLTTLMLSAAVLAPLIAPHNPYDLGSLNLLDSNLPPAWVKEGDPRFLLGTDDQGRDILSTILYGTRSSWPSACWPSSWPPSSASRSAWPPAISAATSNSAIMRIADVMLTFPTILIALLVNGVAQTIFKGAAGRRPILDTGRSIGFSFWVQYARTVRSMTLVEKNKEYVQAARLIGMSRSAIMFKHVLPNVLSPVLVIATINLALAIITEATLSFLGVGLPPNEPSLGTMIQIGNKYLFSGSWWMVAFPGVTLAALVLAVNLLGDWLRDALNPRLR